jgi:hypothetical protein
VAALIGVVAAGCRDGSGTDERAASTTVDTQASEGRILATAWTDDGLFTYRLVDDGDGGPRSDAASVIDLMTGNEIPVEDPPFDFPLTVRPDLAVVGDEVFVAGVECEEFVAEEDEEHDVCVPGTRSAAVFDLAEGTWRAVELPAEIADLEPEDYLAVNGVLGDGRIVVQVSAGSIHPGGHRFWTYSPSADAWEVARDFDGGVDGVCLAGDELVLSTSTVNTDALFGEEKVDLTLHSLDLGDPSADWVTGEPLPGVRFMGTGLACTDTFAVAFGDEAFSPHNLNQLWPIAHRHRLDDVASGGWDEVEGLRRDVLIYGALRVGDRIALLVQGLTMVIGSNGRAELGAVPSAPPDVSPVWTGEQLVFVDVRRDDEISTARLP